jgi:hypothetical protein
MRKTLAGISILTLLAGPARAQVLTFDAENAIANAKSLLQELKGYATQLQQLQQEIQQVTWLATTADALIQHPNLGAVMQLMNMLGVSSDLPLNPYAIQGLVSGYGGAGSINNLVGRLRGLGSLVNTSYQTDSLYQCTTDSFGCQQQRQIAAGNAGVKGIAGQIYSDLAAHVPVLQGLRDQLAGATDPAQRENIMAQTQIEQTWVQNATGQLQTALLLNEAQQQTNGARDNERLSKDIEAVIAATPK